ncbi:YlbF family regulator [Desulfofundulus sp.]|uniref:YlbF family regulator n=1 Tax=Desulfofundulus sp. TaxID=2282750 RepID=UPI003C70DD13
MSVIAKARELGEEIAHSHELTAMIQAQQAMLQDPTAKQIIDEFHHKQRFLQMIQSRGLELTESQKAEVEDLEKRMLDNPLITEFFRAQQTFEQLLEEINQIISEAISGSQHSCPSESCSCCHGCD